MASENFRDLRIQCIGRARVPSTEGEHHQVEQAPQGAVGEVAQRTLQGLFGFAETVFQRPAQQRLLFRRVAEVVIMLERGGSQVEMTEHITQARR